MLPATVYEKVAYMADFDMEIRHQTSTRKSYIKLRQGNPTSNFDKESDLKRRFSECLNVVSITMTSRCLCTFHDTLHLTFPQTFTMSKQSLMQTEVSFLVIKLKFYFFSSLVYILLLMTIYFILLRYNFDAQKLTNMSL